VRRLCTLFKKNHASFAISTHSSRLIWGQSSRFRRVTCNTTTLPADDGQWLLHVKLRIIKCVIVSYYPNPSCTWHLETWMKQEFSSLCIEDLGNTDDTSETVYIVQRLIDIQGTIIKWLSSKSDASSDNTPVDLDYSLQQSGSNNLDLPSFETECLTKALHWKVSRGKCPVTILTITLHTWAKGLFMCARREHGLFLIAFSLETSPLSTIVIPFSLTNGIFVSFLQLVGGTQHAGMTYAISSTLTHTHTVSNYLRCSGLPQRLGAHYTFKRQFNSGHI